MSRSVVSVTVMGSHHVHPRSRQTLGVAASWHRRALWERLDLLGLFCGGKGLILCLQDVVNEMEHLLVFVFYSLS